MYIAIIIQIVIIVLMIIYIKKLMYNSQQDNFTQKPKPLSQVKVRNHKIFIQLMLTILIEKYKNNNTPADFRPQQLLVVVQIPQHYKIVTKTNSYDLYFPQSEGIVEKSLGKFKRTQDLNTFIKNIDILEFICQIESPPKYLQFTDLKTHNQIKSKIQQYVDWFIKRLQKQNQLQSYEQPDNKSIKYVDIKLQFK